MEKKFDMMFIFGIIAGGLILVPALRRKNRMEERWVFPQKHYSMIFTFLLIFFGFLLTFRVTEIPVPFNVDEAGMAYDAQSLANYHVDRFLNRFPVYLVNFGGGQSALYAYLAAVLIKLFGFSIVIVRLPAILLSVLSAIALTLMIRKEHGNTASLICLSFFCILPFSIMHSRWGLDAYLLFPMMILSTAAFWQAIRSEKTRWFFIAGIMFGITLYSYVISYMIIPLFLFIVLLYLFVCGRIKWKNIIVMGIPLFLLAVPLMLMLAVNNGLIGEIHTRYFSVPLLNGFRSGEIGFRNVINNLKIDDYNIFYEIFANDHCRYNVSPEFGTLYYLSIPILIYGFAVTFRKNEVCIKQKRFSLDLLILFLFIAAFVVSMLIERPNVNRSCTIYIPLIYFLTLGMAEILKKSKAAAVLAGCCYLICFVLFIRYYFTEFPKTIDADSMFASVTDIRDALDYADGINENNETIYVLDSVQPYIFVLLAKQIDPYTFNEQKFISNDHFVKIIGNYRFRLDDILPDCIYIFNNSDPLPEKIITNGFQSKQFGTVTVYHKNSEE